MALETCCVSSVLCKHVVLHRIAWHGAQTFRKVWWLLTCHASSCQAISQGHLHLWKLFLGGHRCLGGDVGFLVPVNMLREQRDVKLGWIWRLRSLYLHGRFLEADQVVPYGHPSVFRNQVNIGLELWWVWGADRCYLPQCYLRLFDSWNKLFALSAGSGNVLPNPSSSFSPLIVSFESRVL